MPNDLQHVRRVMELLEAHAIITWLFGGWAEQLQGLIAPRLHRDIDLLYRADDFALVDRFLQQAAVEEIVAKRFSHKRALVVDGVMTELILVRPDLTTLFWNKQHFAWPADVFVTEDRSIRLASVDALVAYRRAHHKLQWSPTRQRYDDRGSR